MKENFNRIMNFVFKWEGGYTNDPDDPGGETNFGINKRDHMAEDIKGMTRERAMEIYHRQYWEKVGGDKLPWPLDLIAMDAAVNCGPIKSLTWLKKGLGTVPPNWPIMVDSRDGYYRDLAIRRPKMKKFLKGWLNRTRDLRKLAGTPPTVVSVIS